MRLEDFKIKYINNTVNYFNHKLRAADFLNVTLKTVLKYTTGYIGPIESDFIPTKNLRDAENDYMESLFYIYGFKTGKVAKHLGMSHRFTYNKKKELFPELQEDRLKKPPKIKDIENIPDVYLKIFPTNEERLRYLDNPSVRY